MDHGDAEAELPGGRVRQVHDRQVGQRRRHGLDASNQAARPLRARLARDHPHEPSADAHRERHREVPQISHANGPRVLLDVAPDRDPHGELPRDSDFKLFVPADGRQARPVPVVRPRRLSRRRVLAPVLQRVRPRPHLRDGHRRTREEADGEARQDASHPRRAHRPEVVFVRREVRGAVQDDRARALLRARSAAVVRPRRERVVRVVLGGQVLGLEGPQATGEAAQRDDDAARSHPRGDQPGAGSLDGFRVVLPRRRR
mmetsp:Transcript_14729/g.53010  ORF Transcript_14729/g.53010 Transcript_14729/m.53010 type:complete len:258 (-) Transcript_14729:681-1454(-)